MTTLQDACLLITDGKHGDCQNEEGSGYYFISCKDVREGWVDYSGARQITEADYRDTHRRTQLEPNDILITNSGTIGRMALVPARPETYRTTFQKSVAIIKPNQDKAVPKWLYYYLMASRDALIAWAGGTAQKNLLLRDLRAFEVHLLPLPTQRKIAAVLSAYDDLIENNARRIAVLEEMARLLYQEWFARFRFPGHEDVAMVDSELGPVPEEWEVKPIGEAIETLGGGTPSTKNPEYWDDGSITWFTPSDLTSAGTMFISESSRQITELGYQKSSAHLFPPYSVMMTSRATIGVVAINTQEACTNQGFITCIPNEQVSAYQIYFWIEQNKDQIISVASGATYKEINRTEFREFLIAIPDPNTNERFVEMMTPIANQIENLQTKNAILRRTRDLLLPRLVSGKVDVSGLEIAVPQV